MEMAGFIQYEAELGAVLIRKDGSRHDRGIISGKLRAWPFRVMTCLKYLGWSLYRGGKTPLGMGLLTYLGWSLWNPGALIAFGIVTTAGVNYMATEFAAGGVTPTIGGFKFHDSGVGTTAAVVGDTDIETTDGESRVAGTPTNPTANQYRSIATIAYTTTKAITEWGLFSASTAGTLWDRRVFAAINVVNGDSIQFTYTLTVNNGGT